jgi:hypothetical protein
MFTSLQAKNKHEKIAKTAQDASVEYIKKIPKFAADM